MKLTPVVVGILFGIGSGASVARANFEFLCGEGRERGLKEAEISFVDSLSSSMKLYLKGSEVSDEKLGFKALDGGRWIVSVQRGEGSRKFLFQQGADASVQESLVDENGSERSVGAKKKCIYRRMNE